MSDRGLKVSNSWRKVLRSKEFENKFEFLNKTKAKYDWDNDDFKEDEGVVEDEAPMSQYPGISAEIPGVDLEYDLHNNLNVIEVEPLSVHAKRVAATAENTNLICTTGVLASGITGVNWTPRNVKSDKESESNNAVDPKDKKGMSTMKQMRSVLKMFEKIKKKSMRSSRITHHHLS